MKLWYLRVWWHGMGLGAKREHGFGFDHIGLHAKTLVYLCRDSEVSHCLLFFFKSSSKAWKCIYLLAFYILKTFNMQLLLQHPLVFTWAQSSNVYESGCCPGSLPPHWLRGSSRSHWLPLLLITASEEEVEVGPSPILFVLWTHRAGLGSECTRQ